jgi:hypothetical protein
LSSIVSASRHTGRVRNDGSRALRNFATSSSPLMRGNVLLQTIAAASPSICSDAQACSPLAYSLSRKSRPRIVRNSRSPAASDATSTTSGLSVVVAPGVVLRTGVSTGPAAVRVPDSTT